MRIRYMDNGCFSPWFQCSCSLPYVTPSTREASVGVWIRFYGQGFACPSVVLVLVCSLADVGMRIRLMGMVSLVSPWSWCSCVHCQTLVCGYGLWAWIALSLRGPRARVFSAMEIPQLQFFFWWLMCLLAGCVDSSLFSVETVEIPQLRLAVSFRQ